jgi:uncharacterized protein (TIGR02246 family)
MRDIEFVSMNYAAAVHAKDEQAFLALYDEKVVVFDAWDEWVYEGREAWSRMVENWFGSLGEERVRVEFSPISCIAEADWAVWCATVRYIGLGTAGEELRSMENRISWTLQRRGGGWLIVHEHSSAPASFETLKVKLKRG